MAFHTACQWVFGLAFVVGFLVAIPPSFLAGFFGWVFG
jgi:hypothetical protein